MTPPTPKRPTDAPLSMRERMRQKFEARQAERRTAAKQTRRYAALEQHARLVYDTDRDVAGEFSEES